MSTAYSARRSATELWDWWQPLVHDENSASSEPQGEQYMLEYLRRGVFIPMTELEVAVLRLSAQKHDEHVETYAKGWLMSGMQADVNDIVNAMFHPAEKQP